MKHINDILNESILDKNLGDNMDEEIIRNWIVKQCGENVGKLISFDEDGRIIFPKHTWARFEIYDEIPNFIKIASCDGITIRLQMGGNITIPDGFLPKILNELEINVYTDKPVKTLNFDAQSLLVTEFTLRGSVSEIILPKKFACKEFNISEADNLTDIKNISKVKKANFSNKFGANLIRKQLKFQGEIRMNGFGPY